MEVQDIVQHIKDKININLVTKGFESDERS